MPVPCRPREEATRSLSRAKKVGCQRQKFKGWLLRQSNTRKKTNCEPICRPKSTSQPVFCISVRERIEARNQLEAYLYNLRNSMTDGLKGKLAEQDAQVRASSHVPVFHDSLHAHQTLSTAVEDGLKWLEDNPQVIVFASVNIRDSC
jgi:hypothetical protein